MKADSNKINLIRRCNFFIIGVLQPNYRNRLWLTTDIFYILCFANQALRSPFFFFNFLIKYKGFTHGDLREKLNLKKNKKILNLHSMRCLYGVFALDIVLFLCVISNFAVNL